MSPIFSGHEVINNSRWREYFIGFKKGLNGHLGNRLFFIFSQVLTSEKNAYQSDAPSVG